MSDRETSAAQRTEVIDAIVAERKRLAEILRRAAADCECGTPWEALRNAADAVESPE